MAWDANIPKESAWRWFPLRELSICKFCGAIKKVEHRLKTGKPFRHLQCLLMLMCKEQEKESRHQHEFLTHDQVQIRVSRSVRLEVLKPTFQSDQFKIGFSSFFSLRNKLRCFWDKVVSPNIIFIAFHIHFPVLNRKLWSILSNLLEKRKR